MRARSEHQCGISRAYAGVKNNARIAAEEAYYDFESCPIKKAVLMNKTAFFNISLFLWQAKLSRAGC